MPSRGHLAHGRDKDETLLYWYNAGWQAWWFIVFFIVATGLAAAVAGFAAAKTIHTADSNDLSRSYEQGYAKGFREGMVSVINKPTETTTTTVPTPPTTVAPVPSVSVPLTG